ncbi:MAG: UPF0175 family protein [Promethearchaeota archaeon]
MAEKIIIKLPADLITLSGLSSEDIEEKSLLIWVLELYSEGKITLSKAANFVHMKNDEFLVEFYKRRLKRIGGPETVQGAQEDLKVARELIEGTKDL